MTTLTDLLTEYRLAHTAEAIAQPAFTAEEAGRADEKRRDAADAALLAYLVVQESL